MYLYFLPRHRHLDLTEPFDDEIHPRLRFAHRGLVAMANNGTKNTNDSQFFITLGERFKYKEVHDADHDQTQTARMNYMESTRFLAGVWGTLFIVRRPLWREPPLC
jgi:cyclophilin family peptidyl-prolyl cis-trans isomerase